jgi:hypothetical protein
MRVAAQVNAVDRPRRENVENGCLAADGLGGTLIKTLRVPGLSLQRVWPSKGTLASALTTSVSLVQPGAHP